ncbi:unnamed protein product, partial [Rhizoctonia solani]
MAFREKWEKQGRAFPRRVERSNDSHTNATTPLSTGLLPNTPILRFLSPSGGLGLSNSDSQPAESPITSNLGGGDTRDTAKDIGTDLVRLKVTTRRANKDELDWIGAKTFQSMLSQMPDSPLKLMTDEFIQCIDIFERATKGGEHRRLRNELDLLFHELGAQVGTIHSLMTPSTETLCRSICEKLRRIRERQGGSNVKWYLRIRGIFELDQILLDYRRIRCDLQRVSVCYISPRNYETLLTFKKLNMDTKTWQAPGNQEFLLERLRPSLSARHDSSQAASLHRGACTSGTRTSELDRMLDWIHDPDTDSTYWLSGMAGTGKTTIVYSLCEQLDIEKLLAASFFCSRSLPECREVDHIMRSIAYQLAQFSYPFRCALSRALRKDPGLFKKDIRTQFQHLISNPLVQVQEAMPEGLVVVIDALDECEDKDSTSQILEVLLNRASHLPVKFVASSRPELAIQKKMDEQRGKRMTVGTISFVLRMTETRVRTALQGLTSVLLLWGTGQLVTTLHTSFLDFMLDPKRSIKYCCRKQIYQEALALGCFRWIRENRPQFNICGLASSFIRDSDVPDLRSRVDEAIPWELYYVCRHWAAHLEHTRKSAQLLEAFFDLLSCRLMLWIEVMNLKNSLHTGPDMLWRAGTWVNKEECDEAIVQLTQSAWQFITDYQFGAAKLSTPHIYQSMLFFLPPSSPLGSHYAKRMRRSFPYDSMRIQPRIELSGRIDFDEKIGAVEWLPNGTRIIAAVSNRIVVI